MNKAQILSTETWKYISGLSLTERHEALFGKSQNLIQQKYDVTIEKASFTQLSEVANEEDITISVTDPFLNKSFIALIKTRKIIS